MPNSKAYLDYRTLIMFENLPNDVSDLLKTPIFLKLNSNFFHEMNNNRYKNLYACKNIFLNNDTIIFYYKELLKNKNIEDSTIKKYLLDYTKGFKEYIISLEKFLFVNSVSLYNGIKSISEINNTFSDFFYLAESYLTESSSLYFNNIKDYNAIIFYNDIQNSFKRDVISKQVMQVLVNPPFLSKSHSNTRSGLFQIIDNELIDNTLFCHEDLLETSFYIGKLKALVLIDKKYINLLIGATILFEKAEIKDGSHDIFLFFGIQDSFYDKKIYISQDNKIYGYIFDSIKNDYFGYLKKILLTMHNIHYIRNNALPIHGAMVKIRFINDREVNIVIIGDSGAGKSETLEAFRSISSAEIKSLSIVFDDMGIFQKQDNHIIAYGTEVGAFIRTDDLESAYMLKRINDAVFFNIDRKNSRLIIPVTSYDDIIIGEKIDFVFYANNYEHSDKKIRIFDDINEAISVFEKGVRVAKGTTSEMGKVQNYFANPFGPVQLEEETKILIDKYFKELSKSKTVFGEIYTMLAVQGYEIEGPRRAANELLKLLLEEN